MSATATERRAKRETAGQRYSALRLEMDQAARARDWDRVRELARYVAREANAASEARWAQRRAGWQA